jgi:hypothetical protein
MPLITGAIAVEAGSYSTVQRRWPLMSLTRQIKEDLYIELQAPYSDEAPKTQQFSAPAGGYVYDGFKNTIASTLPLTGMHVERYKLAGSWTAET